MPLTCIAVFLLQVPATIHSAYALYVQDGSGTAMGKLSVSPEVMASRCITMVSPIYPRSAGEAATASTTVMVRVVILKSGHVSPLQVISGPVSLQIEAMNAVRLWRYKPLVRDGEPVDVTTDVQVVFEPGRPGGMVTHPNR